MEISHINATLLNTSYQKCPMRCRFQHLCQPADGSDNTILEDNSFGVNGKGALLTFKLDLNVSSEGRSSDSRGYIPDPSSPLPAS